MAVKLFQLVSLACFCAPLFGAHGVEPAIEGEYRRTGSPGTLKVVRQPSGAFFADLNLYYAKGHTCSLHSETATRTGDSLILRAPGISEGEPCVLTLAFRNGQAELNDEELRCTRVYCGTRGTFSGVKLVRKHAKKTQGVR